MNICFIISIFVHSDSLVVPVFCFLFLCRRSNNTFYWTCAMEIVCALFKHTNTVLSASNILDGAESPFVEYTFYLLIVVVRVVVSEIPIFFYLSCFVSTPSCLSCLVLIIYLIYLIDYILNLREFDFFFFFGLLNVVAFATLCRLLPLQIYTGRKVD